MRNTATRTMC